MLSLFAAIITKLKALVDADVPRIFEAVFECTLSMITKNFEDFPEHRYVGGRGLGKSCRSITRSRSRSRSGLTFYC